MGPFAAGSAVAVHELSARCQVIPQGALYTGTRQAIWFVPEEADAMRNPKTVLPHSQYLAKMYLNVLVIFGLFILPWMLLGLIPGWGWIYVLVFLAANALWIVPTVLLLPAYYKSIRYEIGEDELVVSQGILTKSVRTIPYRTITDLVVKRDLFDRWLFNMGSLEVQTAGKSAQTGPEVRLVGLTDWDEFREELVGKLRRYRAGTGTGTEAESAVPTAGDADLLKAILTELRGIREDLRDS